MDSMVLRMARELAGHVGPHPFDDLPRDRREMKQRQRAGEEVFDTQDELIETVRALLSVMREEDARLLLERRRFEKMTQEVGECLIWQGPIDRCDGYGRYYSAGKTGAAHRYAWEWENGPIPKGLVIDHICRNRACVRPSHLRTITNAENVLCGEGRSAQAARRDTCIRGHPLDDTNLYVRPDGLRDCRACRNEASRRNKAKRRVASAIDAALADQRDDGGK